MIPYDYEAKGKADYEAGLRDNKLYEATGDHCAAYRTGWQGARRANPWGGSPPDAPLPDILKDRPPLSANNLAKRLETPKTKPPKEPPKAASDQLSLF